MVLDSVTAWRHVKAVMQAAGIRGTQASPKGLRHGFEVASVQAHIPLNLVQRWWGHAQLSTTAIYAEAIGQEEQEDCRAHVAIMPRCAHWGYNCKSPYKLIAPGDTNVDTGGESLN